jgi:hypothetical protein
VAAEDGSSVISENRKAQQASYTLHANGPNDPLWPLYNRVLATANHHAGYNLQPPGALGIVWLICICFNEV